MLRALMNEIIGIAVGALVGRVIEQATQDILKDIGIPGAHREDGWGCRGCDRQPAADRLAPI
jgi:hypothetical protein